MLIREVTKRLRATAGLLCGASAVALIGLGTSTGAFAQDAAAGKSAPTATKSDDTTVVVVTSTRVVRNGYKAPTPTEVLGLAEIEAKAPSNIADLVNQMPAVTGSVSPATAASAVSAGTSGINSLNLRNLGPNRTLVLLDGQRTAPSTLTGWVDVNVFPQGLVQRVDVVTGGASADWGSDAVAGVVNFVLDKKYTGLKFDISGGATTYGNGGNYKVSMTAGSGFASGRGHILFSAESDHNDAVLARSRPWAYNAKLLGTNPAFTATNGQPQFITTFTGFDTATAGGIITSGAAKGTYFGPGGTPLQFNYGTVSGNFMQGGQSAYSYNTLLESGDIVPEIDRQNLFLRSSYDLTDHIEIYGQASYGVSNSREQVLQLPLFSSFTITSPSTNAFLPASVAAAAGTTPFTLGSFLTDLGPVVATTRRASTRLDIGADGDFDALGTNWKWDAYAQDTTNNIWIQAIVPSKAKLTAAINAVKNPATGAIQCASVATNPSCIPFDIFGTGVNTPAAITYVTGAAWGRNILTEDVLAVNLHGNPFSDWAGPVSIAAGAEYRREAIKGTNDPTSNTNGWYSGNQHGTHGSYNVSEAYFETVVPLLKDQFLAKSLDFNGAVRATHYSLAGNVTTWKAGLTYAPIDDINFRLTQSHDIRAPNLSELFTAGSTLQGSGLVDPFTNTTTGGVTTVTSGSTALKPEVADSTGVGVVFQPRFLPGFNASVDYYNIHITDAIFTATAQQIINECFSGLAAACPNIIRTNGVITQVNVVPINLAMQSNRGIDFEASYRRHLAPAPYLDGTLTVRALATHFLENRSNNGITPSTDNVGQNSDNGISGGLSPALPHWKYQASIDWSQGELRLGLSARGVSSGVYNTAYVQCTSGCPTSTTTHPTIDNNYIPGAIYYDANFSYKFPNGVQTYFTVQNIANTDPVATAYGPNVSGLPYPASSSLYDVLGRTYRIGFRMAM